MFYGDILVAICRAMLFDMMTGLFHGIVIWIDYMGYATMHFCQVFIMFIQAMMDFFFLLMYYQDEKFRKIIDKSTETKIAFWFLVIFNLIKMLITFNAYKKFKLAFYFQHGHMNPFGGLDDNNYGRGGGMQQ